MMGRCWEAVNNNIYFISNNAKRTITISVVELNPDLLIAG